MSTYDLTSGLGPGLPIKGDKVRVLENEVDMNIAATGGAAPAQGDVIKVLRVPKGCVILAYGCAPVRKAAGTTLTYTFGATASKGATIAGTAAISATGTGADIGKLFPATLTTPLVDAKAAETDDEDVYLTATMTAVTAITDLGKQRFYAVVADVN